ncbi:MAG: magnesium transporter CorA family protein [Candidatus Spechtbacteria bacterium]|nr:magnesium transporter CorA family protein [Candidatus Spechtbacteria bacterium]
MLRSVNSQTITWIDIQDPTKKDVAFLQQNFHFHPLILDELIPPSYRPKVEHHEDYMFLVLHYPAYNKYLRETERKELDIIITKTHVVTTHFGSALPIKSLFDKTNLYAEKKKEYLGPTTGHLLYHVISAILSASTRKADELENEIEKIEKDIFQGHERAMLSKISRSKRDVIDVRRILAPQEKIFVSLAAEERKYWDGNLKPYFEDIMGMYNGIWNILQEHRETLASLGETNESLLSTKTNNIISALTIITAMSLPAMTITSIWGMRTNYMPLMNARNDFWIIISIIAIAEVVAYYILHRKGWV